ncbi:MAG TPA: hypothetical protein VK549_02305 [Acidimicrobiia bacterium]|nr:hypothetical protein [Acidimicrobiia bacterium]
MGLALQASLKEGGSTTTSSVTCSGVVQLEVKIGDGESLTVRCPPG